MGKLQKSLEKELLRNNYPDDNKNLFKYKSEQFNTLVNVIPFDDAIIEHNTKNGVIKYTLIVKDYILMLTIPIIDKYFFKGEAWNGVATLFKNNNFVVGITDDPKILISKYKNFFKSIKQTNER